MVRLSDFLTACHGMAHHGWTQRRRHCVECPIETFGIFRSSACGNYTNAGVAKGIAYLDFGFIEPALLAAIAKTAKDGQAAPKGLEGHLVTRVAMDVSALVRLQQQIQQVLVSLQNATQAKGR